MNRMEAYERAAKHIQDKTNEELRLIKEAILDAADNGKFKTHVNLKYNVTAYVVRDWLASNCYSFEFLRNINNSNFIVEIAWGRLDCNG